MTGIRVCTLPNATLTFRPNIFLKSALFVDASVTTKRAQNRGGICTIGYAMNKFLMIIRTIFDFQIHVAWLNNYSNLNCTSYASLENILATARTLGVWDLELCQLYQVRDHQWLWSSPRDRECGCPKQVSIVGPLQLWYNFSWSHWLLYKRSTLPS